MNPQTQTDETDVKNPFEGKIESTITNAFTGKKQDVKATYSLPMAVDWTDLTALTGGNEKDVLFWFNYGRRIAARAQVNAKLSFDLGDEKLNELWRSFNNAMTNMGITDDSTQEHRDRVRNFILSEPKFESLRTALDDYKPGDIHVDFSEETLRKPSGKRGPRRKSESGDSDSDSE